MKKRALNPVQARFFMEVYSLQLDGAKPQQVP
jgi:hypothetical protein